MDLERSHPDRTWYLPTYTTIRDLREGATTLLRNVEKYLPRRSGEELDVYRARIANFCYTPVMNTAIREFSAKLASSPVNVDGADGDFWVAFRTSLDGHGQDETEFIIDIFSTLLYYGKVFLAVDVPEMDTVPRSLAEDPGNYPFIRVFSPMEMLNYGDDWYCARTFRQVTVPFAKPTTLARWTYFTTEETVAYEAQVGVSYDDNGDNVTKLIDGDRTLSVRSKNALVPAVARFRHDLGSCPVVCLELPPELWTAHHVYLKQLQYIRIESAWAEAGGNSGVVQRVYKPMPATKTDDPSSLYIEPNYDAVKFDNSHVLVGAGYEFVESKGDAIKNLSQQLAEIRAEINAIVSMGYKSAPESKQAQSGKSKDMDMTLVEDSMRAYGQKVAQLYERVLKLVAQMGGQPTDISVAGLDRYSNDTLTDMVANTAELQPVWFQLPPTALKIWVGKMAKLMTGATGRADTEAIEKELEEMFMNGLDPNDPEAIVEVAASLGILPEEAQTLLTGAA